LHTLVFGVFQVHALYFEIPGNLCENSLRGISQSLGHLLNDFFGINKIHSFVVTALVSIPESFWITTVAAPITDPIELHPMPFVIALIEAILTQYTGGILFAIETSPGDVTCLKSLSADTHRHTFVHLI
jgi:hypothetical protein